MSCVRAVLCCLLVLLSIAISHGRLSQGVVLKPFLRAEEEEEFPLDKVKSCVQRIVDQMVEFTPTLRQLAVYCQNEEELTGRFADSVESHCVRGISISERPAFVSHVLSQARAELCDQLSGRGDAETMDAACEKKLLYGALTTQRDLYVLPILCDDSDDLPEESRSEAKRMFWDALSTGDLFGSDFEQDWHCYGYILGSNPEADSDSEDEIGAPVPPVVKNAFGKSLAAQMCDAATALPAKEPLYPHEIAVCHQILHNILNRVDICRSFCSKESSLDLFLGLRKGASRKCEGSGYTRMRAIYRTLESRCSTPQGCLAPNLDPPAAAVKAAAGVRYGDFTTLLLDAHYPDGDGARKDDRVIRTRLGYSNRPSRLRVFRFANSHEMKQPLADTNAGDLNHVCKWLGAIYIRDKGAQRSKNVENIIPKDSYVFVYRVRVPTTWQGYSKLNGRETRGIESVGYRVKDMGRTYGACPNDALWYAFGREGQKAGNWEIEEIERVVSARCLARTAGTFARPDDKDAIMNVLYRELVAGEGICPDVQDQLRARVK